MQILGSLRPRGDPLMRQPSAEDLDAAQQLISSARGAREALDYHMQANINSHNHDSLQQNGQRDAGTNMENTRDGTNSMNEGAGNSKSSTGSSSNQTPSFPSHSCSNCGTKSTPLWRRSPTGAMICNACGLYLKARNAQRPTKRTRVNSQSDSAPDPGSGARSVSPGSQTATNGACLPQGSCPGGGNCNGTGGAEGCEGCPAYNNRMYRASRAAWNQAAEGSRKGNGEAVGATPDGPAQLVSCQNCGTTVTPLWRRDENGNPICNACGLYYKLHGCYRPVTMKKPTIKRRKRVVPAARDQSPDALTQSSGASSASPEAPAAVALARAADQMSSDQNGHVPPNRPPIAAPPPVDFTGYNSGIAPTTTTSLPYHPHPAPPRFPEMDHFKSPRPPSHSPSPMYGDRSTSPHHPSGAGQQQPPPFQEPQTLPPLSAERKDQQQFRPTTTTPSSFMPATTATPPSRVNSISSILNQDVPSSDRTPRQQQDASNPSGYRPSPNGQQQQQQPDSYVLERRAQLQREADAMREALRQKEQELAQLGGGQ